MRIPRSGKGAGATVGGRVATLIEIGSKHTTVSEILTGNKPIRRVFAAIKGGLSIGCTADGSRGSRCGRGEFFATTSVSGGNGRSSGRSRWKNDSMLGSCTT